MDSVAVPSAPGGTQLRDGYIDAVRIFTLGLAILRDNSLLLGPFEMLRFGTPKVTRTAVEWPIEGGLLSRGPGGRWRLEVRDGRVEASLDGWTPRLPRPLYALTQLQVHMLFTRLYLLRLHGRVPARVSRPTVVSRRNAGVVDIAFCLTLAGLTGRRRPRRALAIAVAYHVACWSTTGRTLGGMVMRQRVVAVDGSRLTPMQALLRLAALPLSWLARHPVHDDIAASEVIEA